MSEAEEGVEDSDVEPGEVVEPSPDGSAMKSVLQKPEQSATEQRASDASHISH